MRILSAPLIYSLISQPITNGALVLDLAGRVQEVLHNLDGVDAGQVEHFSGALCPGFVNTHCHLELSHLRNKLPQGTGLPRFIAKIQKQRFAAQEAIDLAMVAADALMRKNGIVAVGDVSNGADSFLVKEKSAIFYHTFVELMGLSEANAEGAFQGGLGLIAQCTTPASLAPHATYSVSNKLMGLIKDHNQGELICLHNQETPTEDELFEMGAGALFNQLQSFGALPVSGQSALQTTLKQLPSKAPTLLVHNTFTQLADVQWAQAYNLGLYWCTCPKANLYIEGRLPDYTMLLQQQARITIGTDSLASNDTLSILEELKTIQHHTNIDLNTLLTWACKNGADFLQQGQLGTFEKGKTPGVVQLTITEAGKLSQQSSVEVLA